MRLEWQSGAPTELANALCRRHHRNADRGSGTFDGIERFERGLGQVVCAMIW